ncbi:MAG: DUF1648 domain-containing protein [Candidatus Bathyarchaeia archaeon]
MGSVFRPAPSRHAVVWGIGLSAIPTVPFIVLLYYARDVPLMLQVSMTVVPVFLTGFMLYLTVSGKRMSYELDDEGLRIRFFSGLRIPYAAISSISLSSVTLVLRLYGGSWPGLHWGLFEASKLGRLQVYGTRAAGTFALIRLVNGDRLAVTPEEPERFLMALDAYRASFGEMTPEDVKTVQVPRRMVYGQVLAVTVAYLAFVGYVLWVYPSLPEIIPAHFNLNWQPDRWGHKSEFLIIPAIVALLPALNALLTLKFVRYDRGLMLFLGALFTLIIVIFLSITIGIFIYLPHPNP